jgi:hypothetical protein
MCRERTFPRKVLAGVVTVLLTAVFLTVLALT